MRKFAGRFSSDSSRLKTGGDTHKTHADSPLYPASPLRIRAAAHDNSAPADTDLNRFQHVFGNIATLRYFNFEESIQPKHRTDRSADQLEQEADRAAEQVIGNDGGGRPNLSATGATIQRAPVEAETTPAPPAETTQPPVSTTTAPPEETKTPTPGLIVDDAATELLSGQMKKSVFLAQLRAAVCETAEAALAGTIWSALGCPWIDHWFGYYAGQDSQSIERAIQRYTGASGVTSAADYIPIICARVRSAIEVWRTTGEVKGVPEGVPTGLSETPSPAEAPGPLSFKPQEGTAGKAADPAAVQARLDTGSPLDSGIRSQMESAFGQDFSGVRVHTDERAETVSNDLNARAFTVGRDIAFASGEYQPGTLIGDALIAHELAHVVQQGGGTTTGPMQKGETQTDSFEEEADTSAVGAMVSLWGGMKTGLANIARNAMPRLRSGLRLQRCKAESIPRVSATYTREEKERMEAELKAKEKSIKEAEGRSKTEIEVLKDKTILYTAISAASPLLDEWHTGVLQAVNAFKPNVVQDKTDISTALAGNLMWAATSIPAMPSKVILSLVGATIGTLGAVPSNYATIMGPIVGDLTTNLNNLRSDTANRLDVIIFPYLKSFGFDAFNNLSLVEKRRKVWSWIFTIPWDEKTIEKSKIYALNNLKQADGLASDWLEGYRKIWQRSVQPAGVDLTGPKYYFNYNIWSTYTSDPVEIYAGRLISFLDEIRLPNQDPLLSQAAQNKRGASLLRLAIEKKWPLVGKP